MKCADANIILRFLTGDDPVKAAACLRLMQRLQQGLEEATTSTVIFHEVLYVLSSRAHYGLSHPEAAARLKPIVALRGLQVPHKRTVLHALDVYTEHPFLDFGNALSVAEMARLGIEEIISYERDFDRAPGIKRVEP